LIAGYINGDILIEGPLGTNGFNATFEVDSFGSISGGTISRHGSGFSQGSEISVAPYFSGTMNSQVRKHPDSVFFLESSDFLGSDKFNHSNIDT
jgi:hypothetical protein